MQSKATTVAQYLAELPADRRRDIEAVRKVILKNIDKRMKEGMSYGMIGYYVPHSVYPAGYHCDPKQPLPFACLASQKNYMSIYMMTVYGQDEAWFREQWAKTGKRLDMGKSCVRFRTLEDLALDVIGEALRRQSLEQYIANYESILRKSRANKEPRKTATARVAKKVKPKRKTSTVRTKKAASKNKSAKRKSK